jgi:NADPH:quinone reductase-like Zn-dependent oxidoreductase
MRAAVITEVGGDPVLREDFPEVTAGSGQVLVAPIASAVNVIDLVIARGGLPVRPSPLPYVPGREGIGEVRSRGPWQGQTVWFEARGGLGGHGAQAELAVADEAILAAVPAGLDPRVAARFGISGTAAWLALTWRARLEPGETVLVLGSSGAVGQIAVQAARVLGAGRIVAAARSKDDLDQAREMGADEVVALDGGADLADRLRAATAGRLDVIVDPLWGPPAAAALAAASDGARHVQLGGSAAADQAIDGFSLRPQTYGPAGITGRNISLLGHTNMAAPPAVRAQAYRQLIAHVADGEIRLQAVQYPLGQAARAYREQACGPHHKVVIDIWASGRPAS